jgi:hypothetical protein
VPCPQEYNHTLGIAIIGGYIYHGTAIPALQSEYVYGDYGSGRIWALSLNNPNSAASTLLVNSNLTISSFGADETSEIYVCAFDGEIYKLVAVAIPEMPFAGAIEIIAAATPLPAIALKNLKSCWRIPERDSL